METNNKSFGEKFKEKYIYWRYLGSNRDTLDTYADRVSQDNLSILCTSSTYFSVLSVLASLFIQIVDFNLIKFCTMLLGGLISLCVDVYAHRVRSYGTENLTKTVNTLITIFQFDILGVAIAVGTVDINKPAVLIVAAIVFSLVAFNLFPKRNLLVNLFGITCFFVISFIMKPPIIFAYDLAGSSSIMVFGYVIAWKKARDKWEHEEAIEIIKRNNTKLYESSTTDSLTGLANRRYAFDNLETFVARSSLEKTTFACMIMDIDFFKSINDNYGHPAGDELLRNFGKLLSDIGDKYDIVFSRIGGEEFMGYWTPSANNSVELVSSEILVGVHELPFPEEGRHATISIGVFNDVADANENGDRIYTKADKAVYKAKQNGRDRVEFYDESFGAGA